MEKALKKFKKIDLIVLLVLALLSELLSNYLLRNLSGANFRISFSFAIAIAAYVRWGISSIFIFPVAQITASFIFANGNYTYAIMRSVSSLGVLTLIIPAILIRNNKVSIDLKTIMLYALIAWVGYILTMTTCYCLLYDHGIIESLLQVNGENLFIFIMSIGLLYMLKKTSVMLVDVKKYFEKENWSEENGSV